jgi:DNA-binding LacI/PurR family transcriptional regulator
MGREMVRMLLTRIAGGTPDESLVILPTHLVTRDSA